MSDVRHLPARAALYLQASIVLFFLAASSAPTPLYAVYQREWGFSPITTTVVFGVYALAVLLSLLTVGALSDYVGRRRVLIVAIAMQAITMLIFDRAGGVGELMIGRVIQGLATGAAVGAVGAGMLDLDRVRGTTLNSVAPMLGTASGAILSGLLVQYLPAPLHLVYLTLFTIFVLQGIGVLFMAETASPKAGALAALRPTIGVPRAARGPLLLVAPVLVAVWALAGFYGSVGPAVVRKVSGSNSLLLGGLGLFVLAGSGAATVLVVRRLVPRAAMVLGTTALIVGVGVTLLGVNHTSPALFFIGTAIAGVGFGAGFQAAIRTVVPLALPDERSSLLSTVYVISYLAMGLPAVIAGFLVVHGGGLLSTAREYGVAVMILAALALIGVLLTHPAPAVRPVPQSRELARR